MRYMGSKARHAKHIAPILESYLTEDCVYVEPFCGGGNMLSEVKHPNKWGNDTSFYAVKLLSAVSNGWVPPEIVDEALYKSAKDCPHLYSDALVGFLAYCCSYAGKEWGGFARGNDSKGEPRNFASEQTRNLSKQVEGLSGCIFTVGSYLDMDIPDGSVVYCDPPYTSTTGYKTKFNNDEFWLWCKKLSETCVVLVSEYAAPDYCRVLWSKEVTSSLTKDTGSKTSVEKLFLVEAKK